MHDLCICDCFIRESWNAFGLVADYVAQYELKGEEYSFILVVDDRHVRLKDHMTSRW